MVVICFREQLTSYTEMMVVIFRITWNTPEGLSNFSLSIIYETFMLHRLRQRPITDVLAICTSTANCFPMNILAVSVYRRQLVFCVVRLGDFNSWPTFYFDFYFKKKKKS